MLGRHLFLVVRGGGSQAQLPLFGAVRCGRKCTPAPQAHSGEFWLPLLCHLLDREQQGHCVVLKLNVRLLALAISISRIMNQHATTSRCTLCGVMWCNDAQTFLMASKEMGQGLTSHSSQSRCQALTLVSIGLVEDLASRLASRSSRHRLRLAGCAARAASKDALA